MKPIIDEIDRRIVNQLQHGLPLAEKPYEAAAAKIGVSEGELIDRLARLKSAGVLSRIGPMYNAAGFGGGLTLCAMAVPEARFEDVAAIVNGLPEVAHNYAREHRLSMWFVVATENEGQLSGVIAKIERLTGVKVLNLPKLDEYFIGMKVEA